MQWCYLSGLIVTLVVMLLQSTQTSARSIDISDSVQAFGEEQLCKNRHRRQGFFFALVETSGSLPERIIQHLVHVMCKEHSDWLTDWVTLHVDTDGDGKISQSEKNLFDIKFR